MARAVYTPIIPGTAGATVPLVAGTNQGGQFVNDGHTYLLVVNGNAASRILTVQTGATYGGHAVADDSVTIGGSGTNGGRTVIGPFPPNLYNQAADPAYVYIDFPAAQESDLSVAVIR